MIFDFEKFFSIDDYKVKLADQVKDIDIAMVFLNAGMVARGAFVN